MARSALRDPKLFGGALCIGAIVAIAIIGTFFIPYDPRAQDLMASLDPPSFATGHWLGTDQLGRDILARVASGARVSLEGDVDSASLTSAMVGPRFVVSSYRFL